MAAGAADLALRQWDGEWVAYVGATGSTHLLGPIAGKVLESLARSGDPLTPAALSEIVSREGSGTPQAEGSELIEEPQLSMHELLEELERIGLATMRPL